MRKPPSSPLLLLLPDTIDIKVCPKRLSNEENVPAPFLPIHIPEKHLSVSPKLFQKHQLVTPYTLPIGVSMPKQRNMSDKNKLFCFNSKKKVLIRHFLQLLWH